MTLKLKTADFRQRTRAQTIHAPTQLAGRIFSISREMLSKEIDGTAFRLIGTGVSALQPGAAAADEIDMLDRRTAHAERAIDDLRKKFGDAAVIKGIAYEGPEKPRLTAVIATACEAKRSNPEITCSRSGLLRFARNDGSAEAVAITYRACCP